MNSRIIYGLLFGIVAMALLWVLAIPFFSARIPAILAQHTQEQVRAAGHEWPQFSASGRDLTISGKAPTPAAHREVLDIAAQTPGLRTITDKMTPRIISPYTMNMIWKDQQFTSSGFLPDEVSLDQTRQLLHRLFGENGRNDLRIGGGYPPAWRELVGSMAQVLPAFEYANINLINQDLELSGKIATTRQLEQLTAILMPYSEQGYRLNLHVVAADASALRCQQQFNALLKQSIAFASGKNRVNPGSFDLLQNLADTALFCPDEAITISGHTDNRGSPAANERLSKARAEAVAAWLVRAGVAEERLTVIGHGAKFPIADNETEAGRAQNRRIEFKVGDTEEKDV